MTNFEPFRRTCNGSYEGRKARPSMSGARELFKNSRWDDEDEHRGNLDLGDLER